MNDNIIEYLKGIAQQECFYDDDGEDVCVDDFAGGNVDYAFQVGERAGEAMLARRVLEDLGVEWGDEE